MTGVLNSGSSLSRACTCRRRCMMPRLLITVQLYWRIVQMAESDPAAREARLCSRGRLPKSNREQRRPQPGEAAQVLVNSSKPRPIHPGRCRASRRADTQCDCLLVRSARAPIMVFGWHPYMIRVCGPMKLSSRHHAPHCHTVHIRRYNILNIVSDFKCTHVP